MLYPGILGVRNPWRELDRIHREFDRFFNQVATRGDRQFPPINVYSNQDEIVITSELPGFQLKDIRLSIVGNELTMKGKRELPEVQEGEYFLRHERMHGDFERTIQLPFVVDHTKIDARLKDGVLMVRLPRAESDKPITIEIKEQ